MSGSNCLEAIGARRSVRDLSGELSGETVEMILGAGARAPSPHNTQPWRFVVMGPSSKTKLADILRERYLARFGTGIDTLQRAERIRRRISSAPLVVLLCLDRARIRHAEGRERVEWVMATQSLAAAAENMWIAAVSVGLDAMWMAAPLVIGDAIREGLGLDGSLEPQILMAFGRGAARPPPKEELGWRELSTFLERVAAG
ncbi:MAG: nitroreductase family protein [Conexivisphaera sp.]